jgi:cobalamin biosynthesis protein CobD/CbiB
VSVHTYRVLVGFVFLLPAGTFIVCGLLGLDPPPPIVHPLVLIGGLAAALVINFASTVNAKAKCKDGALLGGLAIQVQGRVPNLAVVMIGMLLVGAIALYLFVENFVPR